MRESIIQWQIAMLMILLVGQKGGIVREEKYTGGEIKAKAAAASSPFDVPTLKFRSHFSVRSKTAEKSGSKDNHILINFTLSVHNYHPPHDTCLKVK